MFFSHNFDVVLLEQQTDLLVLMPAVIIGILESESQSSLNKDDAGRSCKIRRIL